MKQLAVALIAGLLFSTLSPTTTLLVHAEDLPAAENVELHNTTKGIRITWGNVSHAYKYEVYRSDNGGAFNLIATLSKQNAWQYTDEKTRYEEGTRYSYYVRALAKKNVYTPSNSETVSIIRVCRVTDLKLKCGRPGVIIECSWEDHENVDGYEIRVYAEHLKRFIVRKKTRSTNIKFVSLYPGKTYRVQVRPYVKADGKYYFSNWSKNKKIRAKNLS